MGESDLKKKSLILSIVFVCILALISIAVALGFSWHKDGNFNNSSVDNTTTADTRFTFGQTYTINGKQYTLGSGEYECIDYYTALGLSRDEYAVTLTKFTYRDGRDGTEDTTSVRNAGTYEFEIAPLSADAQPYNDSIVVYAAGVDIDVNLIGAFVNASTSDNTGKIKGNSAGYAAHGDITTIYQHNDAWYSVQKNDEPVVNTRTITNAYYSYDEITVKGADGVETGTGKGKYKPIQIMGEILPTPSYRAQNPGESDTDYAAYKDAEKLKTSYLSSTSTYRYGATQTNESGVPTDGVKMNIKNRTGCVFSEPGEYVASFQFDIAPGENYTFNIPTTPADKAKLSESYRGLYVSEESITSTSFVLKKYWYIVVINDMMAMAGYKNGNEPYSPFAYREDGAYIDKDYTLEDFAKPGDGSKFAITDTVTYGDGVYVNEPWAKADGATVNSFKFSIDYESPNGKKKEIASLRDLVHTVNWQKVEGKTNEWTHTDNTITDANRQNTVSYYLNKYMPAGTYTLSIVVEYTRDSVKSKMKGEYKLYVLPKAFSDSYIEGVQETIRGKEVKNPPEGATEIQKYLNKYSVESGEIHEDITDDIALFDAQLAAEKNALQTYWATDTEFFDTKVTVTYSVKGWSASQYVDRNDEVLTQYLSSVGDYEVYYRISAQNYVSVGGADDPHRTERGFSLKLTSGVSIYEIYSMILDGGNPYFKDVTYTGDALSTTVPSSSSYHALIAGNADYNGVDFVNAGAVYTTLELSDNDKLSWDDTVPSGVSAEDKKKFEDDFSKYFELTNNNLYLRVKYNIRAADNSWSITPRMPSWTYDAFSKANHTITGQIRYKDDETVISFRLGKKIADGNYKWVKVNGEDEYFTIDGNGQVNETVAASLKALGAGTYYLDSKATAVTNGDTVNVNAFQTPEASYYVVEVGQAENHWDTAPYVVSWAYRSFSSESGYFNAGTPHYKNSAASVVYKLYSGTISSGTPSGNPLRTLTVTKAQDSDDYELSKDGGDIDYLYNLVVGNYTIIATYTGTADYADLTAYMPFNVTKTTNSWSQTPFMRGWAYSGFSADEGGNFQAGIPANADTLKEDSQTKEDVLYTLYRGSGNGVKVEANKKFEFTDIDGNIIGSSSQKVIDALKALDVGAYTMVSYYKGTTNYADLSTDAVFSVSKAENTWDAGAIPSIKGWTYNGTRAADTLVKGISKFGSIEYTVQKVGSDGSASDAVTDLDGVDFDTLEGTLIVGGKLTGLNAGSYNLHVEVDETDNYTSVSRDLRFVVSKADNAWANGTGPTMASWTFGENASTPAGVATVVDTKQAVIYRYYGTKDLAIDYGNPVSDIASAFAGRYALIVTVPGNENYNDLISDVIYFEIGSKAVRWKNGSLAPLRWTLAGRTSLNADGLFVEVETDETPAVAVKQFTLTYTIRRVGSSGVINTVAVEVTASGRDTEALVDALKELDVGSYTITITATFGNGEFASLTMDVSAEVSLTQIELSADKQASCEGGGWTWGVQDEDKKFNDINVSELPGAKVTYRIGTGDTWSIEYTAFNTMLSDLRARNVGNYTVEITVKCENYETKIYEVAVEIRKAENTWTNSFKQGDGPKSVTWVYGNFSSSLLTEPTAKFGSNSIVYTITKDGGPFASYRAADYPGFFNNTFLTALSSWNAGVYEITLSVAATANYGTGDDKDAALTDVWTFTVSKIATAWNGTTNGRNGTSYTEYKYGEQTFADITAPVLSDADLAWGSTRTPIYSLAVEGSSSAALYAGSSWTAMLDELKKCAAGNYTISARIEGDENHNGLTYTVYVELGKADNSWKNNISVTGWDWSDNAGEIDPRLTLPIAEQGETENIVVYRVENGEPTSQAFTFTVNFVTNSANGARSVNTNDETAFINKLKERDAGNYRIVVSVGALANYNALGGQTIDFTVGKPTNSWRISPSFSGGDAELKGDTYQWTYGSAITVNGAARFGTYSVTYSNTLNNNFPRDVGEYTATFTLPSGTNYNAGDTVVLKIRIVGSLDDNFTVLPGVTDWSWGHFERHTNLFAGIPRSLGNVTFEIYDEAGEQKLFGPFKRVSSSNTETGEFSRDLYVLPTVEEELNKFTAGTYTLKIIVAASGNYKGFSATTTFNVTEAANSWEETPRISAWYLGAYNDRVNAPVAKPKYGTATITIAKDDDTNDIYYRSDANGTLDHLGSAPVGWYVMTVSVKGETGKFLPMNDVIVSFQVFVNSDQNFWVIVPSIEGWTANVDDFVVMPTGTPHRGSPYFEFYRAEFENDEYQLKEKIEAGEDSYKVDNPRRYARVFFIPTAPGTYYMLSYAENGSDVNDYLGVNHSSRILFTIRDREISWDQTVRIPSVLYLGEQSKWVPPTARTNIIGSDDDPVTITYRYLDAATRRDLGTQIPTVAGKYIVRAYASARYTQTITSEMMFEVALSKNAWVNDILPSITGWSEEFGLDSPDPVGAAEFGTITYIYVNKEQPDIYYTERPTAAGDYIMIARVELEGYETLEARYEFTISPAFDNTLVTIDIILGLVACAFAVVVIVFAIRRYKEN